MRPVAITTSARRASDRFLRVRLVGREPCHTPAVVGLGWERGAGPLFCDDLPARGGRDYECADWRETDRVALDGRHVVGYISLRLIGSAFAVRHLVVTQPLWRMGVGGQLLGWARDQLLLPGVPTLAARIDEDNLVAHRFLARNAFKPRPRSDKDRASRIYRYHWTEPEFRLVV